MNAINPAAGPAMDPGAVDWLYRRFSARLSALAADRLALFGPAALDDVDDVTQEVWARAVEADLAAGPGVWDALAWMVDHVVADRDRTAGLGLEVPAGLAPRRGSLAPADPTVPLTFLPQLRAAIAGEPALLSG